MITRFNNLYNKILHEQRSYENNGLIGPIIPNSPKYQNNKIVFLPGSFKPPQIKDINRILQYCNIADFIYIFISNTSIKSISNRILSKSNLQQTAKFISSIQELNLKNQTIDNICNQIIDNSNTLTYNILIELLNKLIEQFNLYRNIYDEYINKINKIKDSLDKSLFKSIRKTTNDKEITPEISKGIFETYINKYNLQNKVNVIISKNPSPMIDIISFVNNKCKNCIIYLGSTKNEDNIQWDSLLKKFEINPTNEIVPYSI